MKLYLIDLESIQTRYTCEWKKYFPTQLSQQQINVEVIEGPAELPSNTTPGMFLNFSATNIYKSVQAQKIAQLFSQNKVNHGDYFLFADAWNPTVIQLKYMSSLLGINIRIGGLWHAGSYDKNDGLGRLIGNVPWVRFAEHSMFSCYDHNFFATQFHVDMFAREMFNQSGENSTETFYDANNSIHRVGWPMEYLKEDLAKYRKMPKQNLILFPHRIAPEKQVNIFRDLKQKLPQYEFVVCQDRTLTKSEYHDLLGRAKLVFSANLQETLGISWYEGVLAGAIPMVPDRLSYTEMALPEFKYPSEWTSNEHNYLQFSDKVARKIVDYMEKYNDYQSTLENQILKLSEEYFSGQMLYDIVKNKAQ